MPLPAAAVPIITSLVSAVAGAVVQGAINSNNQPVNFAIQNAIDSGLNALSKRYMWNHGGRTLQQSNQLAQSKAMQNYFSQTFHTS